MNPTLISAIAVGLMAASAFSLDILSSPKESRWWSLPLIFRWEVRITGTLLMVRSFDLWAAAAKTQPALGQVNALAMACSIALAITGISLVAYAINSKLPAKAWDRIGYVLRTMRKDPDSVPVMMTKNEVIDVNHAAGQAAVSGNDPGSVARESGRYGRMVNRHRG